MCEFSQYFYLFINYYFEWVGSLNYYSLLILNQTKRWMLDTPYNQNVLYYSDLIMEYYVSNFYSPVKIIV